MGLFDWITRRPREAAPPIVWHVFVDGSDVVVEDGRGQTQRVPRAFARSVRVVPLTGGNHHAGQRGGGWQVTLSRSEGDVLVGSAMTDWRAARDLAQQLCDKTELPLDELTERMFSRVGRYTPAADA